MPQKIQIGDISMGGGPFVFIGGPCVIEGRDVTLRSAEALRDITAARSIPFIFKSSYDKANRTSLSSFRGPGLEKGLEILAEVRNKIGVPVLTDVHSIGEAYRAADVVDVLQVPAFLCRQTDLLVACGKTGRAVNIKKGQFMAPREMGRAVEKVMSAGNGRVFVTERGTSFGYNTLVNDFRAIPIMQGLGFPVVFDATHSVQKPGGLADRSGGEREFVFGLARAAVAIGADGIFMEVHEKPEVALCDGENSVPLKEISAILDVLKRIEDVL